MKFLSNVLPVQTSKRRECIKIFQILLSLSEKKIKYGIRDQTQHRKWRFFNILKKRRVFTYKASADEIRYFECKNEDKFNYNDETKKINDYHKKYELSELSWSKFLYCTQDLEICDWAEFDYEVCL